MNARAYEIMQQQRRDTIARCATTLGCLKSSEKRSIMEQLEGNHLSTSITNELSSYEIDSILYKALTLTPWSKLSDFLDPDFRTKSILVRKLVLRYHKLGRVLKDLVSIDDAILDIVFQFRVVEYKAAIKGIPVKAHVRYNTRAYSLGKPSYDLIHGPDVPIMNQLGDTTDIFEFIHRQGFSNDTQVHNRTSDSVRNDQPSSHNGNSRRRSFDEIESNSNDLDLGTSTTSESNRKKHRCENLDDADNDAMVEAVTKSISMAKSNAEELVSTKARLAEAESTLGNNSDIICYNRCKIDEQKVINQSFEQ